MLPHLAGVVVERVERCDKVVVLVARARGETAACPNCGVVGHRVHARYERSLRDVALGGIAATLRLTVRRFLCSNPECPAATFAEQIPGLTSPHARYTPPLAAQLTALGLALAGRAGSRLAAQLGITVGRDTLLRRVRALPDVPAATGPQVLGIDDFALRKGRVYGTVLVDITAGRPVDLLPERTAEPVKAWLLAHPGVQVVCRDRAGAYAEAARDGAPGATQVADRWHLWSNLCDVVEKTVSRHRGCLREPVPETAATPIKVAPKPSRLAERTVERHRAVHEMLAKGASPTVIQRRTGWDPKTVRRYADAADPTQLMGGVTKPSLLDEFKPFVIERWNDGVIDAVAITAELRGLGYSGSERTVRRFLEPYRKQDAKIPPAAVAPSVREATTWLTQHPDSLGEDDAQRLKAVLTRCPELEDLSAIVRDFAKMMANLDGHLLDGWLAAINTDNLPDLLPLTRGIRHDHAAVTAGLSTPFNSGVVEGHVNRIKMLKRQMFGRANFDLLRLRVLYAT